MPLYNPPMASREKEYLFIDGGCLNASVRKICQELFGDPNCYRAYIPSFAGGFDKVFYYDAVPAKEHGENDAAYEARVQPEHDRFAKIQALDRVHVALGHIVGSNRRQKGVDVRLAVDMMTYAFRGTITKATLFAGDADFVPLIEALVREGLHVTLWHPAQANERLRGAADTTRLFEFKRDFTCLTSDGQKPAFRFLSSGSGQISSSLSTITNVGDWWFSGSWRNGELEIWRTKNRESWEFSILSAPGADLQAAARAFDMVYPWDIAATAEQWVERAAP
ncbi:NYN domain-containing protein [Rhizobium laguerreae]|uniref:NYN domain-containing protein n=1 Tax=Rhizobium laguerreae TaxID=1076926 RepID=UPI001C9160EA|nr:NYN domain-containing protein [Rhizobium laguerreae]MBY3516051.1 NYN domain-containing protein [Rhizobium laguerreae]